MVATVLCLVCVFYTSIGGLKTVIWTDFLQFAVILTCLLTVFVTGLDASAGISSVWNTAVDGQRLHVFKYSLLIV